jgi:hypothetical protein
MPAPATAQWWVRVGGANTNGAGFDPTISGAGTNYSDQDALQWNRTNLATPGAGSTTLTSATAPFTAAMIGNGIRIIAGTNFATGTYFITGYTSSSEVTLHESPTPSGAGSSGNGTLGGAGATPWGVGSQTDGNTIWIRGNGDEDPTSVSYSSGASYIAPGSIKTRWKGYNGRPLIVSTEATYGLIIYQGSILLDHLAFKLHSSANSATYAAIDMESSGMLYDCVIDQAGYDKRGVRARVVAGCHFKNTGSTSAGTYAAIGTPQYGSMFLGNRIKGWRGPGIQYFHV